MEMKSLLGNSFYGKIIESDCMVGTNQANQKTKNGWKPINCDTFNCEYRQKNEYGKSACNRIGWLKFMIPSVCKDRVFLMRITGQTSLNRLDEYFNLQKAQGYSIKGKYTLFLKQEEQSNTFGKTFNNYVLDILKKEDFISQNTIQKTSQIPNQLSTDNDQTVNKEVVKSVTTAPITKINDTKNTTIENSKKETEIKNATTNEIEKKETKSKSKKAATQKSEQIKSTENKQSDDKLENCYALLSTFNEKIADKDYLIGEFADMKDHISNIVIRPEDAIELEKCDLGTFVKLDISEIKGRKFAIKLEFIDKALKKVAA